MRNETHTTDRVCLPQTTCGGNSSFYLSTIPLTTSSPFVCSKTRNCMLPAQFEAIPPTLTSDRKCAASTKCTPTEYELSPPTFSVDRTCAPLRVCQQPNEFEMQAPKPDQNRVCRPTQTCTATAFEAQAPSPTSDRVCVVASVCDFYPQNTSVLPPFMTAVAQIENPVSYNSTFELLPLSKVHDRACQNFSVCDWSTEYYDMAYSDHISFRLGGLRNTWKDWALVFDSEKVEPPVSYVDARAYGMWEGLFEEVDINSDGELDTGELQEFKATNMSNSSDPSAFTKSKPAVQAEDPEAPNAYADWECKVSKVCDADPSKEYEVNGPSMFLDRECGTTTTCVPGTFEIVPPSATSNRACQTCDGVTRFTNTSNEPRCKTMALGCADTHRLLSSGAADHDVVCEACPTNHSAGVAPGTLHRSSACVPVNVSTGIIIANVSTGTIIDSSSDQSESDGGSTLSTGAIAAIVIVVLLLIIGTIVVVILKQTKWKTDKIPVVQLQPDVDLSGHGKGASFQPFAVTNLAFADPAADVSSTTLAGGVVGDGDGDGDGDGYLDVTTNETDDETRDRAVTSGSAHFVQDGFQLPRAPEAGYVRKTRWPAHATLYMQSVVVFFVFLGG